MEEPLKVFTAFSGYDSQCMALDRISQRHFEFNYELVGWSEIDKFAICAHNIIYPQWANRNYGDITQINWDKVPDFDLFTWSFPCQDISYAGLQRGAEEGSDTRSALGWHALRAILHKRPKYALMENVKALVGKKNISVFEGMQKRLEEAGYSNYWKVLNAADYGVPQHRERVFMVSILNDDGEGYEFPKTIPLTKCIGDILEDNVDESYYCPQSAVDKILGSIDINKLQGLGDI